MTSQRGRGWTLAGILAAAALSAACTAAAAASTPTAAATKPAAATHAPPPPAAPVAHPAAAQVARMAADLPAPARPDRATPRADAETTRPSTTPARLDNAPDGHAAAPDAYGCAAALAYLRANAAPGFTFECPGYAWGHQAMTCVNHAPQCPGTRLITIAVPCAAAYKNEASNSWVLLGLRQAAIDPYGYCH